MAAKRVALLKEGFKAKRPVLEDPPVFVPKCNLPELEDYKGVLPDAYWDKWNKCELNLVPTSWINPYKFWRVAWDSNFPRLQQICEIVSQLHSGFSTGAEGASRLPARGENLPAFYTHAYRACDAIQVYNSGQKRGIISLAGIVCIYLN